MIEFEGRHIGGSRVESITFWLIGNFDIRQVFVWNPQDCFFQISRTLGQAVPKWVEIEICSLESLSSTWPWQLNGTIDNYLLYHNSFEVDNPLVSVTCALWLFSYWHWSAVKANAMSWDVPFYLQSSVPHFHFLCIASHTIKDYFVQFLLISNNLNLSSLWGKSPRTFRCI